MNFFVLAGITLINFVVPHLESFLKCDDFLTKNSDICLCNTMEERADYATVVHRTFSETNTL